MDIDFKHYFFNIEDAIQTFDQTLGVFFSYGLLLIKLQQRKGCVLESHHTSRS
jgi:hypothetical protein